MNTGGLALPEPQCGGIRPAKAWDYRGVGGRDFGDARDTWRRGCLHQHQVYDPDLRVLHDRLADQCCESGSCSGLASLKLVTIKCRLDVAQNGRR